ncbi:MAG: hypothetical protein ACW98X_26125, partial [Promethearchaeota archaeon]
QTAISVYLAEIFHFISQEYPEDSIIYKILNNLCYYYMNRFYRLIDIGDDNDCWWIPGPPPDS